MIKIQKESRSDINILNLSPLDLYHSIEDRAYFKKLISKFFKLGEEVFFFFRREENLTDDSELKFLKKKVLNELKDVGEFRYLFVLDEQRFDAIGRIIINLNFPNLLIDMWKYFYSCDFFIPINDLSFEEYEDYLQFNGVDDINGLGIIQNKLAEFIFIKGLGADNLIISYNSDLKFDINAK